MKTEPLGKPAPIEPEKPYEDVFGELLQQPYVSTGLTHFKLIGLEPWPAVPRPTVKRKRKPRKVRKIIDRTHSLSLAKRTKEIQVCACGEPAANCKFQVHTITITEGDWRW